MFKKLFYYLTNSEEYDIKDAYQEEDFNEEVQLDLYVRNLVTHQRRHLTCLVDPDSSYDIILPWTTAEELGLRPHNAKEKKKVSFLGGGQQYMTMIDGGDYGLYCIAPVKFGSGMTVRTEACAYSIFVYRELEIQLKAIKEPVLIGGYLLNALTLDIHYDRDSRQYAVRPNEGTEGYEPWDFNSEFPDMPQDPYDTIE